MAATALYRLVSLPIIAEIMATPISAAIMNIDPWIPFMLAPIVVIIGAMFSIFVPETLRERPKASPMLRNADDEEVEGSLQAPSKNPVFHGVFIDIIDKASSFATATNFIWQNPKLIVSLAVVFAGILDKSSLFLLLQYASTRYHWTISKDLTVARLAAVSGIIGYFLIFTAPTAVPLTIGCLVVSLSMPFVVAIISVANSFTPPDNTATLYTAISVSQSIGIIIAGPIFAKLYGAGMHIGLEWSGLPFAVAGSLFAVVLVPLLFLGSPSPES
ncbi:hypothetical protein NHQ30_010835 [Ciborinia camelliae]|nr:hypothetical protein NHQ30_010835 [Ciborinia camelliae]